MILLSESACLVYILSKSGFLPAETWLRFHNHEMLFCPSTSCISIYLWRQVIFSRIPHPAHEGDRAFSNWWRTTTFITKSSPIKDISDDIECRELVTKRYRSRFQLAAQTHTPEPIFLAADNTRSGVGRLPQIHHPLQSTSSATQASTSTVGVTRKRKADWECNKYFFNYMYICKK